MRSCIGKSLLVGILALGPVAPAAAQTQSEAAWLETVEAEGPTEIERGAYLARAADCMSCHIGPDGTAYAGGKPIETPLGDIVAPNITPSDEYGIGDYDLADFRAVLRDGRSPDHMLYPAMPYAYYRDMPDEDIAALWAYMQTVEPVERAPEAETDLPFPFNVRLSMRVWNALALDDRTWPQDPQLARGAYLVDVLGHCGACHTPRNGLMIPQDDQYLGGAKIRGWIAPNITPADNGGLGHWEVADIADYLRTGQAMDVVQAAGPMAEVVHFSTRHLDDDDLMAIGAYLKSVPTLPTPGQERPIVLPAAERPEYAHEFGSIREDMTRALADDGVTGTARLYVETCASCHGVDGQGQAPAYYPPLQDSATIRRADATNLVQVIANGVQHEMLYRAPPMPALRGDLTDPQIAELANYVRTEFGGFETSDLAAEDVNAILNPVQDLPFYIEYAATLAWIAIALVLIGLAALGWLVWSRYGRGERSGA